MDELGRSFDQQRMKSPTRNSEKPAEQLENDRKLRSRDIKRTRVMFWLLALSLFVALTIGDVLSNYLHRHWAHSPSHFVISAVLVAIVVLVVLGPKLMRKRPLSD